MAKPDPAAVEALRQRHQAGDGKAALEALLLYKPCEVAKSLPDGRAISRVHYPELPAWLDRAIRDALLRAVFAGEDSILGAFGLPVGRGHATLAELTARLDAEHYALGLVLGMRYARRMLRIPFPRGETAEALAAILIPGGPSVDTVKRRCRQARRRQADTAFRPTVERVAHKVARWVFATGRYPPWPQGLTDSQATRKVLARVHGVTEPRHLERFNGLGAELVTLPGGKMVVGIFDEGGT